VSNCPAPDLLAVAPVGATSGTILGRRSDGRPIYAHYGAAVTAATVSQWIPIEYGEDVVQRVMMNSAVEKYARPEPMRSATKEIPRSQDMAVTVGTTYTDDSSTNDKITLTARRFISRFSIDEDDLSDVSNRLSVFTTKGNDFAISYADTYDNACLGVSAAEDGTATAPFTSLYKALRTTDSGASYVADDNYVSWDDDLYSTIVSSAFDTGSLYAKLSATFKKVETGKYWSQAGELVIAAPGWRDALRLTVDGQGRPIFVQGQGGTPDTLFGAPIAWSRGCKKSATMTRTPSGPDLLYVVNREYLVRGERGPLETRTDPPRAQDDSDNYSLKFRARRAFKLAHPSAAAVLERVTD
jgi:hypothetical protein